MDCCATLAVRETMLLNNGIPESKKASPVKSSTSRIAVRLNEAKFKKLKAVLRIELSPDTLKRLPKKSKTVNCSINLFNKFFNYTKFRQILLWKCYNWLLIILNSLPFYLQDDDTLPLGIGSASPNKELNTVYQSPGKSSPTQKTSHIIWRHHNITISKIHSTKLHHHPKLQRQHHRKLN